MATSKCSYGSLLETAPTRGQQQSILLIEDDNYSVRWVQEAFRKHNQYKLECVTGLSDALSRLLDGGIDVILLDLGLPDCSDGLAYGWVREAAPGVPVLVFTASSRDQVDSSVVPEDIAKFMVKGQISALALVEAVADALGTGGTTD
jgi:DNA-binding NtrC family response regulator